jgi:hypothetical protein
MMLPRRPAVNDRSRAGAAEAHTAVLATHLERLAVIR